MKAIYHNKIKPTLGSTKAQLIPGTEYPIVIESTGPLGMIIQVDMEIDVIDVTYPTMDMFTLDWEITAGEDKVPTRNMDDAVKVSLEQICQFNIEEQNQVLCRIIDEIMNNRKVAIEIKHHELENFKIAHETFNTFLKKLGGN